MLLGFTGVFAAHLGIIAVSALHWRWAGRPWTWDVAAAAASWLLVATPVLVLLRWRWPGEHGPTATLIDALLGLAAVAGAVRLHQWLWRRLATSETTLPGGLAVTAGLGVAASLLAGARVLLQGL
jgi:hypothetical protein